MRKVILDIPVDITDISDSLKKINHALQEKKKFHIVTVNAEMIMLSKTDNEFCQILKNADLVIPDGSGVVWAISRKGTKIKKLAGIELAENIIKHTNTKIFLLGGQEETISLAYENLKKLSPQNNIIGYRNGYFKEEDEDEIIREINSSGAEILLIGLGVPRQEKWIVKHKEKLNASIFMGVGGSFDVFSGKINRAPLLMRNLHLEWLYRLYKEPWRWKRMLALPKFAGAVLTEKEKG